MNNKHEIKNRPNINSIDTLFSLFYYFHFILYNKLLRAIFIQISYLKLTTFKDRKVLGRFKKKKTTLN